jgi:hypothetical protein
MIDQDQTEGHANYHYDTNHVKVDTELIDEGRFKTS